MTRATQHHAGPVLFDLVIRQNVTVTQWSANRGEDSVASVRGRQHDNG